MVKIDKNGKAACSFGPGRTSRVDVLQGIIRGELFWDQEQSHAFSRHCGGAFDLGKFLKCLGDLLEHGITAVLMKHLAATEENCELDLVPFLEEFAAVLELNVEVMLVGLRAQPYSF